MDIHDSHLAELRVTWNGYQVYLESEGELKSYSPFTSWEDAVNRLFEYAKPTSEEKSKQEKIKQKDQDKKKALSVVQQLRLLWGI